uniref:Uncharacterized protein n=1 Tax=Vespula pensylvanica TaxID=30213 RepID=A0A834P2L9_VESPE|nr:hypothetical protein H0235_008027 [Vespula pensylvanica]
MQRIGGVSSCSSCCEEKGRECKRLGMRQGRGRLGKGGQNLPPAAGQADTVVGVGRTRSSRGSSFPVAVCANVTSSALQVKRTNPKEKMNLLQDIVWFCTLFITLIFEQA